jgi:hypothetical protein
MPYIKQEDRPRVDLGNMAVAGELNYTLTKAALRYVEQHGKSYQTFNDIIGALEGAKAEFYRRVVAPYEDEKIKQNGDVY